MADCYYADGNYAKEVSVGITYDLWINGVQATSANLDDLPAIFGYNPYQSILYVQNLKLSGQLS